MIKNGKAVNLFQSASRILSNFIVKCFFGVDVSEYIVEGKPFGQYFFDLINEAAAYS